MRKLLKYLWENEDGFFGIGYGPSSAETTQYGELANLANFATSQGEGDIALSDNFFRSLLSGDPSKIATVLGPEISGINRQGQQELKTLSEFGDRSGGTAAAKSRIGDTTRSRYDTLVSGLTSGAAGALGSQGSGLLSTGAGAHEGAFSMAKTIHDEKLAKWNDLFKSIMQTATAVFAPMAAGGATAAFPGMTGADISGAFGGPSEASPISSTIPDNTVS